MEAIEAEAEFWGRVTGKYGSPRNVAVKYIIITLGLSVLSLLVFGPIIAMLFVLLFSLLSIGSYTTNRRYQREEDRRLQMLRWPTALDYKKTRRTLKVCIGREEKHVFEAVIDPWHGVFSVTTDGRVESEENLGKGFSSSFSTVVGLDERHRVEIETKAGLFTKLTIDDDYWLTFN